MCQPSSALSNIMLWVSGHGVQTTKSLMRAAEEPWNEQTLSGCRQLHYC